MPLQNMDGKLCNGWGNGWAMVGHWGKSVPFVQGRPCSREGAVPADFTAALEQRIKALELEPSLEPIALPQNASIRAASPRMMEPPDG